MINTALAYPNITHIPLLQKASICNYFSSLFKKLYFPYMNKISVDTFVVLTHQPFCAHKYSNRES